MTVTYLTRTYYYDGELLDKTTFLRDQTYVRDLVSFQNSYLYTSGVVDGLTASSSGTSLDVSPGMAIDSQGRALFSAKAISQDIALEDLEANKVHFAYLIYGDDDTPNNQTNLQNSRTVTEKPQLAFDLDDKTQGVGLCSFKVDDKGNVSAIVQTEAAGRLPAKLKLPLDTSAKPGPPKHAQPTPAAQPQGGAGTKGSSTHDPAIKARPPGAGQTPPQTARPAELGVGAAYDSHAVLSVGAAPTQGGDAEAAASFHMSDSSGATAEMRFLDAKGDGTTDMMSAQGDGATLWRMDARGQAFRMADGKMFGGQLTDLSNALRAIEATRVVQLTAAGGSIAALADGIDKVCPAAVSTASDGTKLLSYEALTCLLIETVKEMAQRIQDLEDKASRA